MFKICTQCCVSKIFCTSFSDRASDRHHAAFGLHQLLAGIRAKSQQRLLRIVHFYDCERPSIFWALCSIDDGYRGHAHDLLNKIMTVALRVQCHKCLAWLNLARVKTDAINIYVVAHQRSANLNSSNRCPDDHGANLIGGYRLSR